MEHIEFGFVIVDEEELTEEERANLPWYNENDGENDGDGACHPSPNIDEPDPWAMYVYNEESDYY